MRTTIYIKDKDLEKWQAIRNKSEWVEDMLNGQETGWERKVRQIAKEEATKAIAEAQGY